MTVTKQKVFICTWTAERHISGSSPPPSASRFSMYCINWFGSSVSYTGPTAAENNRSV